MKRVPSVLIRRPRQLSQIDRPRLSGRAITNQVVVITGPSGTGKTVLAGQLVDRLSASHRLAWCRLAPGWSRAVDLPTLVAAALGQSVPEIEDGDLMLAADSILEHFELAPTVLVIDDLHQSEGSESERLLAELASYLPDDTTVIVTSRRRPAELIGLVDGAILSVVDAEDLSFRSDEVEALFRDRGHSVETPSQLVESTGGWATAVVAAAEAGDEAGAAVANLIAQLLSSEGLGDLAPLAQAAAVLPYVTAEVATALGVGDGTSLDRLVAMTSLASESGGAWRLHDSAAEVVVGFIDDDTANQWRVTAAEVLAGDDPLTAIELLIAAGAHGRAGELLASRSSEIGADRATEWLYRVPAEVRQRMPPVLTGGRATVNVSMAVLSARGLVDNAPDNARKSEGLLGLGSLLLATGDLAEAAGAFESCLRLAVGDEARRSASEQLAETRWFAGDTAGARAALVGDSEGSWAQWLLGVIALTEDDLALAGQHAVASIEASNQPNVTDAPGASLRAAVAYLQGDGEAADVASAAYETALRVGGRDVAAAGPVHGWLLQNSGDYDGALAVAEQIERSIGRHDFGARVHTALIRRGVSEGDPNLSDPDRDRPACG